METMSHGWQKMKIPTEETGRNLCREIPMSLREGAWWKGSKQLIMDGRGIKTLAV